MPILMTSKAGCFPNCRVWSQERRNCQPWQSGPSVLMKWAASGSRSKPYFEILLFWRRSQWRIGNSSQFLSTPVSGPLSIAREEKGSKQQDELIKFQAQFTCASGQAHQPFHSLSHPPSTPQLPLTSPGSLPTLTCRG